MLANVLIKKRLVGMEGLFVLTGYGTSRADLLIGLRDGKDTQ